MSDLHRAIRAGIALFNAGAHHAAHDAWEDPWLEYGAGTPTERFLHGLIQYTAAVHHAHNGNHEGATGLAGSALAYLSILPSTYCGVALEPIRHSLGALRVDPDVVSRTDMSPLLYNGEVLGVDDLVWDELIVAATAIAESGSAWDETVIDRVDAVCNDPTRHQFDPMLREFITASDNRSLIYDRLTSMLSREERDAGDVGGLFDNS